MPRSAAVVNKDNQLLEREKALPPCEGSPRRTYVKRKMGSMLESHSASTRTPPTETQVELNPAPNTPKRKKCRMGPPKIRQRSRHKNHREWAKPPMMPLLP